MLIVDKHCSDVCFDDFPVPQTDRKSKQVNEHSDTENFICNQCVENSLSFYVKYQNLWMNNKVRSDNNVICLYFFISAEYLHKI